LSICSGELPALFIALSDGLTRTFFLLRSNGDHLLDGEVGDVGLRLSSENDSDFLMDDPGTSKSDKVILFLTSLLVVVELLPMATGILTFIAQLSEVTTACDNPSFCLSAIH
jgi:hypothetical protein